MSLKAILAWLLALTLIGGAYPTFADEPSISAKNYWLVETGTGNVLTAHQADQQVAAASLTKLMTCLLTLEALENGTIEWKQEVVLPSGYVNPGGSSMYLKPGERVNVEQLLRGLMIVSGNDAAGVLATLISGSEKEFADEMNARAKVLGLKQTVYINASGFPEAEGENYTSAEDVGKLSEYLLSHYGEQIIGITSNSRYKDSARGLDLPSTNTLMQKMDAVDGLKTGHTDASGYCMSVTTVFDEPRKTRLVAVVMGTDSKNARDKAAGSLLEWGRENYEYRVAVDGSRKVSAGLWKSLPRREIVAVPQRSVEMLYNVAEDTVITVKWALPESLPLRKKDVIGTISAVMANGESVDVPLISETEIRHLSLSENFTLLSEKFQGWIRRLLRS